MINEEEFKKDIYLLLDESKYVEARKKFSSVIIVINREHSSYVYTIRTEGLQKKDDKPTVPIIVQPKVKY